MERKMFEQLVKMSRGSIDDKSLMMGIIDDGNNLELWEHVALCIACDTGDFNLSKLFRTLEQKSYSLKWSWIYYNIYQLYIEHGDYSSHEIPFNYDEWKSIIIKILKHYDKIPQTDNIS